VSKKNDVDEGTCPSVGRGTSVWKKLLTVPGVLAMSVLTAAIGWGVPQVLTHYANASPESAVAFSFETDPGKISGVSAAGRSMVIPVTKATTGGPGPNCDGFHSWVAQNSGIDANHTTIQITAQGKRDSAVLLSGMRVQVLTKETPQSGIIVRCPTAGTAQIRGIAVNLDASPPSVTYKANGVISPFGFTLAKGETETFVIDAVAGQSQYAWRLVIDLVVDGVRTSVPLGPPQGFMTTVVRDNEPGWEWDYQSSWHSYGTVGDAASVPAGEPLRPLS
jgi:hypothetical protein